MPVKSLDADGNNQEWQQYAVRSSAAYRYYRKKEVPRLPISIRLLIASDRLAMNCRVFARERPEQLLLPLADPHPTPIHRGL